MERNIYKIGKELFITSDEEIKEGDWLIVNDEDVMQMKSSYDNDMSGEDIWVGDSLNGYATYKDNCKKIILTTDQSLDDVQAITNTFAEWFIKNPSCEEVEVNKQYSDFTVDPFVGYKIIIPKEEPKQDKWNKLNKELDDALEASFGTSPSNILDVFENAKLVLREHIIANKEEVAKDLEQMREWSKKNKQETLEEAAEQYLESKDWRNLGSFNQLQNIFTEGAKWMQERMYSEEDLKESFKVGFSNGFASDVLSTEKLQKEKERLFCEWFEQFKKK